MTTPFQNSRLGNPMDRGTWRATGLPSLGLGLTEQVSLSLSGSPHVSVLVSQPRWILVKRLMST